MDADDPVDVSSGEGPEVFDFLEAYLEDMEEGQSHDLDHYLERFPGREEAISREFRAQREREEMSRSGGSEALQAEAGESRVGPYELVSEIGRGGQGVVYLAEDTRIERRVALKVLPPAALILSQDRRHRLRREAEVISRLAHPGICGIFDAEIGEELAYIAMPFVEGRTLASTIAGYRDSSVTGREDPSPIPVAPKTQAELMRLLQFFEEAARAMHSAHDAGVVHRDIKPANLMVTPDGHPVWLDFGQARDVESSIIDLTLSGEVFGTPAYMSPEQINGGTVSPQTDVWALGVSLFEALTLTRPFSGTSAHALMSSIQRDDPLEARDFSTVVNAELTVVFETALERDLSRRYSSALDFAEDLARLRRHEPIQARPAGVLLRTRRWIQRHPVLFLAITGITIGLVVTLSLLIDRDKALRHALGRHLAERSQDLLEEDPASALVLGIEAVEHASNYLTRAALFAALKACQLRAVYEAFDESGEPTRIMDIAVVPDGKHVVAVHSDGTAGLYQLISAKLVSTWRAHEELDESTPATHVVACSADGRLVASGGEKGEVHLHDLSGSTPDLDFEGPGGKITELTFGVGGRTLAVRGAEGGAGLFAVDSGEALAVLLSGPSPSSRLRFDDSSGVFIETPERGKPLDHLRVWDGGSGKALPAIGDGSPIPWAGVVQGSIVWANEAGELHSAGLAGSRAAVLAPISLAGELRCAALSVSGLELFVSLEVDGRMDSQLITLATGVRREFPVKVDGGIDEAVFSPTDALLAVACGDGIMRVCSVSEQRVLSECRGSLFPRNIEWSLDGESIVTHIYNSPYARLWFATPRPDVYQLHCGDSPVREVAFAPDGERAFTRTDDGDVRLWATPSRPSQGREIGVLLAQLPQRGAGWDGVLFSPRGEHLLVWGGAGAELWDVDPPRRSSVLASDRGVVSAGFHFEAEEILLVDDAGRTALLDFQGEQRFFLGNYTDIRLAEYSPDAASLVSSHEDGTLRCWNWADGTERWTVPVWVHESEQKPIRPVDIVFRPDGGVLALASSDLKVRFYGLAAGEEVRESLRVFPPESLDWSSDGRKFLVTGTSGRGAVRVLDLQPPDPKDSVMSLESFHAADITSGCFSSTGSLALTTSLDGTIKILDISGAEESRRTKLIANLRCDGGAVLSADFSLENPLRVIAGLENGSAGVWHVDPLPAAKARQPRDLAEWEIARERRLAEPLNYR